jgi:hypothetical protein
MRKTMLDKSSPYKKKQGPSYESSTYKIEKSP